MNTFALKDRLARAERHIAHGLNAIERQWATVERLEAEGNVAKAAAARDLLKTLLQSQRQFEKERDRLLVELGQQGPALASVEGHVLSRDDAR